MPGGEAAYKIKLDVFEGPLDLLLSLINKNKIDIYDIPIAFITGQYLEYLTIMKDLNIDIAGEFIVMAATLIHIKSKMLLPAEERVGQEEEEDPRAELVQRLIEYQSYKEAAFSLKEKEAVWENIFSKEPEWELETSKTQQQPYLINIDLYDLVKALQCVIDKKPFAVRSITKEHLTIKDKIAIITERLEFEKEKILFDSLFTDAATKVEVIITFLALLEILRLGLAYAYQDIEFSHIWIRKR
ncbi:segregation and condensation protein A [Candidatus Magnetominusculus xianensis]|uniref:Segregation and condensation protein A n=1 Tax=Candidatus Magnetominusculus xianensis TaxID=1748249 RepID=A0ABR5SAW7_9BACT|nr:segregation/condensation protein A [Candidatus Magnetominusculus xianensis]KWT75005.1 chromosome segregation protein ScpA [Candidatus Magnetominusculus xianensis]MBF0404936.1 segregation/condensation protein A [Nitrospirota bacterium]